MEKKKKKKKKEEKKRKEKSALYIFLVYVFSRGENNDSAVLFIVIFN